MAEKVNPEDIAQFGQLCVECTANDILERVLTLVPEAAEVDRNALERIVTVAVAMGGYVGAMLHAGGLPISQEEFDGLREVAPDTIAVAEHTVTAYRVRTVQ